MYVDLKKIYLKMKKNEVSSSSEGTSEVTRLIAEALQTMEYHKDFKTIAKEVSAFRAKELEEKQKLKLKKQKQKEEDALTLPDLEDLSPPHKKKGGKKKTRKYKLSVYNDSCKMVRTRMRSIRNRKQY
jgi:hypothetical protein